MPLKTAPFLPFSRRSVLAAFAGLALGAARGNSARAQSVDDLPDAAAVIEERAPEAAPKLQFTDTKGKPLSLADYHGHGLIVNVWATWCGPCVAELPTLAAIGSRLARNRILVLPISVDADGAKAVSDFYASHGIGDLPILLDPTGASVNGLNAGGIPVTVIVDPRGQLVGRLVGGANWDTPATLALVRRLAGPQSDMGDVQPS